MRLTQKIFGVLGGIIHLFGYTKSMTKNNLLAVMDQAMTALQAARKEIAAGTNDNSNGNHAAKKPAVKPVTARRGISEEGRQRIAEAQRKRWAVKKRAAKKAARLALR